MNNKTYLIAAKNVLDTLKDINGNVIIDSYYLKYKNLEAGVLEYDPVNDKYSFIQNKEYDGMPPFPVIMINKEIDAVEWDLIIRNWIDDRVIQENRPEIKKILNYLNLCYYDKWDICRRNLGMSMEDYFWITKDKHMDYRSVSLRYNLLKRKDPEYRAPFPMTSYLSSVEYMGSKLNSDKNKL